MILYGHPGAGQTMNCGWHTACVGDPPQFGSALDWANSGGAYVNWRSFGYRTGLGASFDENIGRVRELVLALPYRPGGSPPNSALVDSQTENGRLVQSLVARADEFADGKAIEARLREIGFSPASLEPPTCYKLEVLFQEKGKTVELGC